MREDEGRQIQKGAVPRRKKSPSSNPDPKKAPSRARRLCNYSELVVPGQKNVRAQTLIPKLHLRELAGCAIFRIRVRFWQIARTSSRMAAIFQMKPISCKNALHELDEWLQFFGSGFEMVSWNPLQNNVLDGFEGRMRSVLIRSLTGMILFFSFQDEDTHRWSGVEGVGVRRDGRCRGCAGLRGISLNREWDPA